MPPNDRHEREISNEVSNENSEEDLLAADPKGRSKYSRDECKTHVNGGKVPLLEDWGICLKECEDESITEAAE